MREIFIRHKKLIIGSACAAVVILLGVSIWLVHDIAENKRIDAEAVTLTDNLTIGFGKETKISDFLANLNGELINDYDIDTEQLGEQEISFDYINIKNKKRKASFKINVVDETAPRIYGSSSYTVNKNYSGDLTDFMLSGDDLDDNPRREIIGEYNTDTVGDYNLEYVVTDAYNNETRHKFTLHVVEPQSGNNTEVTLPKLQLNDVIKEHKTEQTKIGIDVSAWQGEIDWEKVKAAGVEFAMIRLGYQVGFGEDYVLDKYYQTNIENAEKAGLPVGVYFYSYANSVEEAKNQAQWILEQLDGHKVELGVAFDWESWSEFNGAGMSFRTINLAAQEFLDTIAEGGFRGWLYSSKVYLERIWEPGNREVWLAQYYDHVTYDGDYGMWQMSNTGRVDGIYGDVDIDIMYLEMKKDTKEVGIRWNLSSFLTNISGILNIF